MEDEEVLRATTWVWFGVTPYRCAWSWNSRTDLIRLEMAASWWQTLSGNSRKRFVIEQKALHDRVDRARVIQYLAQHPEEYVLAAEKLSEARRDNAAIWVGIAAYVLLLACFSGLWELTRSWHWGIPFELLAFPSLFCVFIINPAADWFRGLAEGSRRRDTTGS